MAITKVSEITSKELADYLKLDYDSLTDAEIIELDTLLSAAKAFIKSYTGIYDVAVTNEQIGTGDGITGTFSTLHAPVIPDSQTIYIDSISKTEDTDYTFSDDTGNIALKVIPALGELITADYKLGLDAYPDFVIVVYILIQDMYDNRSFYVDKNNLNKVVDTILGMHSKNLL